MTTVHLVGSVALDTAQDVFATAGRLLGPHLKRVPDGEPGGRRLWISWQIPLLRANVNMSVAPNGQVELDEALAAGAPPHSPDAEEAMLGAVFEQGLAPADPRGHGPTGRAASQPAHSPGPAAYFLRYFAVYVVATAGAVMVWVCSPPSDHEEN
jgi:hypothetical protein